VRRLALLQRPLQRRNNHTALGFLGSRGISRDRIRTPVGVAPTPFSNLTQPRPPALRRAISIRDFVGVRGNRVVLVDLSCGLERLVHVGRAILVGEHAAQIRTAFGLRPPTRQRARTEIACIKSETKVTSAHEHFCPSALPRPEALRVGAPSRR
jgi:hypothetical protein